MLTTLTYFVARPREHRKWDRDRYVDANLTNVYLIFKLSSSSSRLCEDCGAVPVFIFVNNSQSVVERRGCQNHKDRAKYLLA